MTGLFEHLHNEHDLILVESEEREIEIIIKSYAEDYARFCIECDRRNMKPLIFEDYLKLELKSK